VNARWPFSSASDERAADTCTDSVREIRDGGVNPSRNARSPAIMNSDEYWARWVMLDQLNEAAGIAERVKSAFEAADLSAFSDLLAADVTWGAPDDQSPECQNRAQVLAWYQRGRESGMRARVVEIVASGDRLVVGLRVTVNRAAESSGADVERWQILRVSGGRIVDILGFDNREEAMARATGSVLPKKHGTPGKWVPPQRRLAADRIELRLPVLSDAATLHDYSANEGGLEGDWVPLAVGATLQDCEALLADWLAGWSNETSLHGPALAVVESGRNQLIGQVGLGDRGEQVVELLYGVAPRKRGHGYASAAVGLVARWLLQAGFASEIELRIGEHNIPSKRVAARAGFLAAGTIVSHVKASGQSYEDLRFVLPGGKGG
jgi:RimJ/RimL family protein N-acetyltransferase/ketosteroid isomerase-like protein